MNILAGKKTLIVNILALLAVILSGQWGFDLPWFHTDQALGVLAAVNVLLRLITSGKSAVSLV